MQSKADVSCATAGEASGQRVRRTETCCCLALYGAAVTPLSPSAGRLLNWALKVSWAGCAAQVVSGTVPPCDDRHSERS